MGPTNWPMRSSAGRTPSRASPVKVRAAPGATRAGACFHDAMPPQAGVSCCRNVPLTLATALAAASRHSITMEKLSAGLGCCV